MSSLRRMGRREVLAVLKSKKQIKSTHFSVIFSDVGVGCAVVVSKKVEKLSVDRNKTKRQVFSIIQNTNITHERLVIFVKSKITNLSYKDIQNELQSLIMKT